MIPFPFERMTKAWVRLRGEGRTPHRELPLDGPAVLRHYRPERPNGRPVFLLYAMINRPYVLDLLPGRSVIEQLVDAGHEVFLLDWGRPGPREANRSIESYLRETVHAAVQKARSLAAPAPIANKTRRTRRGAAKTAPAPRLTLLGYCQGGTYAALYAALYPESVDRLVLMAAPLAFSGTGTIQVCARIPGFDAEAALDGSGNVPALWLRWAFELLRPFDTSVRYLRFFERVHEEEVPDDELEHFLAMEEWVNDPVDHPGRAFLEFHRWFYRDDALLAGGVRVGEDVARLEAIRCPTLLLAGRRDHLVPPDSTLAARERFGCGPVKVLECDCGHIGLSVSSKAHREVWPEVISWIQA
ncbi:MAG: alpha/beta fold hydrolase [Planctomycetes bacterium]|nr:alpha/beta fold hydrolase [Planctomycetota bacterium]